MKNDMNIDLELLFNPVGIAVYGASGNVTKIGGRSLSYLIDQGYSDGIYPINPNSPEVQGLKSYPDIAGIGKRIDVAIIVVSAEKVLDAVKDCAAGGVKFGVVFTAGLGEMGAEGKKLQKEIVACANNAGMRIVGPNCLGITNFKKRIPMTFMLALQSKELLMGNVALASQSGAFGGHLYGLAQEMGIGFDYWVTTGNESDVQLNDCLQYLAQRDETKSVAVYMEDARDGNKLLSALDSCRQHDKPVVLLKVGKTEAGSRAAASHTGAMAGNAEVYKAVFRQNNVVQAENIYELLDYSSLCTTEKEIGDARVAVITISGGAGVLHVDKCEEYGIPVAKLSDETKSKLTDILPVFGTAQNPVDITAQVTSRLETLSAIIDYCLEDNGVDVVIIYLGLLKKDGEQVSGAILDAAKKSKKLLMVSWVAGPEDAIKKLRAAGVPVFPEPTRGVKALAAVRNYRKNQQAFWAREKESKTTLPELNNAAVAEIKDWLVQRDEKCKGLSEHESRRVLKAFGLPVVEGDLATSPQEAVRIAGEIGYPVVMKIDSPYILHKSDVGGVLLNISDAKSVEEGYKTILDRVSKSKYADAPINGILVEKMEKAEGEILIGCKRDPMFGHTIAFGMGGIFVEVFKEISLRVAPLCREDAIEMVNELKCSKIMNGLRGKEPWDKEAMYQFLLMVSRMTQELKDIVEEIDINPLFAFAEGKGVKAGDALFLLK